MCLPLKYYLRIYTSFAILSYISLACGMLRPGKCMPGFRLDLLQAMQARLYSNILYLASFHPPSPYLFPRISI